MKRGPWFLLYEGSSADGRGHGFFAGRTEDVERARAHFRRVQKDPYSCGCVRIVTDDKEHVAFTEKDFETQ